MALSGPGAGEEALKHMREDHLLVNMRDYYLLWPIQLLLSLNFQLANNGDQH